MLRKSFLALVLLVTIVQTAAAKDAWVLVGQARGARSGCNDYYTWYTDTIFHNLANAEARVSVVDQGVAPVITPVSFAVPANHSVGLSTQIGAMPPPGMNMVHFDVGDSVYVESRLEYRYDQPCSAVAPAPGPAGKIGFPVFDHLVPAGQLQMHFGTDLGLQRSRFNVGIYNAASVPATAHIEVRNQSCFPINIADADVVVPPNTLVQASLPQRLCEYLVDTSTPPWVKYTIVIVDQPSLTYVTPVSNQQAPNVSFGVGTPR
jgi:hypothetical protein